MTQTLVNSLSQNIYSTIEHEMFKLREEKKHHPHYLTNDISNTAHSPGSNIRLFTGYVSHTVIQYPLHVPTCTVLLNESYPWVLDVS